MANRGVFQPVTSIKTRLLLLLLAMTAVATASIALVAVYVNQVSERSAQSISSEALLTQAENYLVQITQGSARQNDLVLDEVKRETQKIAAFATVAFDHPEEFSTQSYWVAKDHMALAPEGQYANSTDDISSVYVPNTNPVDDTIIRDIELSAALDRFFESTFKNTPNVEAIYFATPRNMVRYFPNVNLGAVLPPDFQATQRVWYTGSTPESDPEKKPWWTPPYVDATGLGLVTTAASPVYNSNGDLLGVIGLDLTLNDVRANVESTRFLQSGYSFLIDNTGHTVALPNQGYRDILGRDPQPGEINPDLSQGVASFNPIIRKMMAGESGFEQVGSESRQLFIAYAPLTSTGWSLGSVVESGDVLAAISTLQVQLNQNARQLLLTRILPVSVAIFILVTLLGLLITNRMVVPIQQLAAEAQKIGAGEWDITLPPTSNDEIGVLANAFQVMVEQIHSFIRDLEKRVAERTRDLERRSTQLQVAAEIARETTAIQKLDELLELAVDLIRGRFGFYHAGIFLLDDQNEFAILSAATGEAGREMLARGHKLKVGQVGMVGYVTSSGLSRVALDVEHDPAHYKNPLLPETRSEMTLPLKAGERIIGALDVQSQYPNAFSEDDIAIMQVLADQLAIAIANARLIQESQENFRQLEILFGSYSQKAWKEVSETSFTLGYEYDQRGLRPIPRSQPSGGNQPLEPDTQPPIRIPIQVRGQIVATLDAWPNTDDFNPEARSILRTIAERLGQTIENARLFHDAQERAQMERLVGQVTSRMRETMDIETIVQTAAIELRRVLNLSEAEIRLRSGSTAQPPGNGNHPDTK